MWAVFTLWAGHAGGTYHIKSPPDFIVAASHPTPKFLFIITTSTTAIVLFTS
jgi:hypothetical protein